jgi:hypothetical protein
MFDFLESTGHSLLQNLREEIPTGAFPKKDHEKK